jgi:hypothetical protein
MLTDHMVELTGEGTEQIQKASDEKDEGED